MDKINNLNQTVELMISEDYKERFIAEYAQLVIRISRLDKVLSNVINNKAPSCFKLSCPIEILVNQWVNMKNYLSIMQERAFIENIDLPEVEI